MNRTNGNQQVWMRRICQLAAIGLLGAGFVVKELWLGGLAVFGLGVLGWSGERFQKSWLSTAVLFTATGIAAGGLWVGAQPMLMISGVIAALAWSELTDNPPGSIQALGPQGCEMVERHRIRLLLVLIVISLMITGLGLFWKWALNFGFLFLIAIAVGVGLFGLFRTLKNLNP